MTSRPIIQLDSDFKTALPYTRLGCLAFDVQVSPSNKLLLDFIQTRVQNIQYLVKRKEVSKIPVIQASRKAYKTLGKDPARYRLSAEALLRRVTGGKSLYQINNVIDLLNLISIETGFSIGGYDVNQIDGSIQLGIGKADEAYQGIGRGDLNIECLPTLRDGVSAFGTPTSDSVRTSVNAETNRFLMILYDFDARGKLEEALSLSRDYYVNHLGVEAFDEWIISD